MKSNTGPPRRIDPFLERVITIIDEWIESEWHTKEAIKYEAQALGWTKDRNQRFHAATLSAELLANRVDGMSDAKFRRELKKIGAPNPGELIRKARIAHAAKLLTHTRLLVKQIGLRAGYSSEKHFTDAFRAACGKTPSEYRRAFITATQQSEKP